jgi:hypothetical protein
VDADGIPMTKRLLIITLTLAASLVLASQALASPISYAGQTWSTFQSRGKLGQVWSPQNVTISGNTLVERINGNTAAGVGSKHWQTYGTYSVTFRFSKGAGKMCILLYGHKLHQEIDFAESAKRDPNRRIMTATLHWGAANHMQHFRTAGDFSQWHTATVEWKPGSLTFLMDGTPFGHTTSHVPNFEMHQAIQTAGANVAGPGAPAQLEVSNLTIT